MATEGTSYVIGLEQLMVSGTEFLQFAPKPDDVTSHIIVTFFGSLIDNF